MRDLPGTARSEIRARRWLPSDARHLSRGRTPSAGDLLVVKVNPEVARYLYDIGAKDLGVMEERASTPRIVLRSTESIEPGAFELVQSTAAA